MKNVVLLVLFVSGCGSPPAMDNVAGRPASEGDASAATTASSAEAIQGGTKDGRDPAVGMVWIKGGGFCTGSLIAPNIVLTAGHCVSDQVVAFYTGTGKGATHVSGTPTKGFVEHRVIDQIAHPSYREINQCPNPTSDVALLRLAEPIVGTRPLTLGLKPPRTGASCRAVGFGVHTDPNGKTTVEQKRYASEKVVGLGVTSVQVEKKTGIVDHGDSGGPLICAGKIEGVTSCGNDPSIDHTEAYYGRVDDLGDWIDQVIAGWQ